MTIEADPPAHDSASGARHPHDQGGAPSATLTTTVETGLAQGLHPPAEPPIEGEVPRVGLPRRRVRMAHARSTATAAVRSVVPLGTFRHLIDLDHRRSHVFQHSAGRRPVRVQPTLVPDKTPTPEDYMAARRLLDAHRRTAAWAAAHPGADRPDVWTMIAAQQTRFASVLASGNPHELARYLCNVSRQDAAVGISQGDREYERLAANRAYRRFVATMAKDKLVSLAELVGSLPVENPEQGPFGASLHCDVDQLVCGISRRIGIDIAPPDLDGGLLKLETAHGLFGERDANAIGTAWLLKRLLRGVASPQICEIGAGTGRVAYWSQRFGLGRHTIIDLPRTNVVQGYYLLRALALDAVALYGEPIPEHPSPGVTVWPDFAIDHLPDADFDLVLNQDSMPEMDRQTVNAYLRWIASVCRGVFVSINHESKPAYGEQLRHVSVSEAIAEVGGFELVDRYPYWLRRGYVVEVYRVSERNR